MPKLELGGKSLYILMLLIYLYERVCVDVSCVQRKMCGSNVTGTLTLCLFHTHEYNNIMETLVQGSIPVERSTASGGSWWAASPGQQVRSGPTPARPL